MRSPSAVASTMAAMVLAPLFGVQAQVSPSLATRLNGQHHHVTGFVVSFALNGYNTRYTRRVRASQARRDLAAVEGTVWIKPSSGGDWTEIRLGGTGDGAAGHVTDEQVIARIAALFGAYRNGNPVDIDCIDTGESLWDIVDVRPVSSAPPAAP